MNVPIAKTLHDQMVAIMDAPQQALSFVISQVAHVEAEVYEVQYPDIQYPELIPVDTSANEWAKTVTFFSMDGVGEAEWINHYGKDIPYANTQREQFETAIHMAGIGYEYTLEEIGQALMTGMPLDAERAKWADRAFEEFVDKVALQGDATKGMSGLLNYPGITIVNAPAGTGGTTWATKTGDEILADVNTLLDGVYIDSNTVETADTLLIPEDRFRDLSRRIGDTTMTIGEFIRANNVYTARSNQPLTIRAVRGLDTAGVGSTHRAIAYRRDPSVLKLHMPMRHRFLAPQQVVMLFKVPGMFRLGGLDVRRPGSVRYMDLI